MAASGVRYVSSLPFNKNPIPDAQRNVAGRQGALIMRIARRSIRKRKKISQPGNPPTDREGTLKRFIFFSWDPTEQAVFIGPERLNKPGSAPNVLEFGGMGLNNGKFVKYQARPFMRPALEAAMAALPELWSGAVK